MITGQVTGIILAGGESKRMGTLKPLVEYKGKPLIRWLYDALSPICSEIIIIANSGDFSELPVKVYPDNYPGTGPAAGIEAGLGHCSTSLAIITSCDTPNLPTAFFEYLLAHHQGFDISIAGHDETNEPLIGVYSKSVHGAYKNALITGDPHPPRIMKKCSWQEITVGPDQNFWHPDLFLNLNTPSDLKK